SDGRKEPTTVYPGSLRCDYLTTPTKLEALSSGEDEVTSMVDTGGVQSRRSSASALCGPASTLGKRRIANPRYASQSTNHAAPTTESPTRKRVRLGSRTSSA